MTGIILLGVIAVIALVGIAASVVNVARDGYGAVPTRSYLPR